MINLILVWSGAAVFLEIEPILFLNLLGWTQAWSRRLDGVDPDSSAWLGKEIRCH